MPIKTCVITCGGAGMNIAAKLVDLPDVHCFDTCDKNITDAHRNANVFLTKGTRGAGKNRKYILPLIRPQVPEIIAAIPEADFYIVVFSMGGGSGSVLAPLIIGQLADRKASFVSFVIGALETTEVLDNDIDTMKGLEAIALRKKLPIVVNYTPNAAGRTFDDINEEIADKVRKVVCLTNQNHARLDVHDIANWVRFTDKHSNLVPQVCELHIETDRKSASNVPEPIAIASLYLDPAMEYPFGDEIVNTVGIVKGDDLDVTDEQLHFIINSVGVVEIMKSMTDARREAARKQAQFVQRNPLLQPGDEVDDDCMVV